ncbi:MAG TPA: hypothetical protein VD884_23270 [Ohtaekwangia sp.]|nr:hypothetical protein [Ohtaekwangia sp.]
MKSFTIIHILLFLLAMLAYQCVQAQDYAVTTKGDTIRGEIKILTHGPDKKIQVAKDKKKTYISLFELKNFSSEDETYYPVKGPNGYTFMKLLQPGYLSLYAYQLENQMSYDGLFLTKRDGTGTEVPNLGFKKTMKKFLDECALVVEKIENNELSKRDLPEIITQFNACMDRKSSQRQPVKVEKEIPVTQAEPEIISLWDALENNVKAHADFSDKTDALEMIKEIKNKISRGEKVPNFMIEGIRNSLRETTLKKDLEEVLRELQ